jgi:hypothetical protein
MIAPPGDILIAPPGIGKVIANPGAYAEAMSVALTLPGPVRVVPERHRRLGGVRRGVVLLGSVVAAGLAIAHVVVVRAVAR